METIRHLLNRIRWDEQFGRGEFEVGIYDRMADRVDFRPLNELSMEKGNHSSFRILVDGEWAVIPFHRIREVRRNGKSIWKR
jgi:uncharacterized protein (UPF0248 family)